MGLSATVACCCEGVGQCQDNCSDGDAVESRYGAVYVGPLGEDGREAYANHPQCEGGVNPQLRVVKPLAFGLCGGFCFGKSGGHVAFSLAKHPVGEF